MARTVFKYPLGSPVTVLDLPTDAKVVHVAAQDDVPTIWVLLDPAAPTVQRAFVGVGTGQPVDEDLSFVGTATGIAGWLVFHVFERGAPDE